MISGIFRIIYQGNIYYFRLALLERVPVLESAEEEESRKGSGGIFICVYFNKFYS